MILKYLKNFFNFLNICGKWRRCDNRMMKGCHNRMCGRRSRVVRGDREWVHNIIFFYLYEFMEKSIVS